MSTQDATPILLIGALLLAGVLYSLKGTDHQTYEGVIVQNVTSYEFYPNAKDCSYSGTPYVLLPDRHFHDLVMSWAPSTTSPTNLPIHSSAQCGVQN